MHIKKTVALLLLTALVCLTASACCFPYRRGRDHDRHDRGDRRDRRESLQLTAPSSSPAGLGHAGSNLAVSA
jgi:hypothetical protein